MIAVQYLLVFIMIYLIMLHFLNFEQQRPVKWLNIAIFIILSIVDVFRQLHYGYQPTRNYDVLLMLPPIFISTFYMLNIFKSLRVWLAIGISFFIIIFMSNVATSFIFELAGLEVVLLHSYGFYNAISALSTLTLVLILHLLMKVFDWKIDVYALGKFEAILLVIFFYISGFFISAMRSSEINLLMNILTLIGGTLGIGLAIYALVQRSKTREIIRREEQQVSLFYEQEQNYQRLQKKNEAIIEFKHDADIELFVLETLLKNGDVEDAQEYLRKMRGATKEIDDTVGQDTGSKVTNAIWYALTNDERYTTLIAIWLGKMPALTSIDSRDMVLLFSNLLNNAFEAAVQSMSEKYVHVEIDMEKTGFSMEIKNSFSGKVKQTITGDFMTTKDDKEKHGIGTKTIKKIVEKYNGVVKFSYSDIDFTVFVAFRDAVSQKNKE